MTISRQQQERPPTEAAVLLFWWAKSRRRKPLVHVRGCFSLPGFADHFVPLRARWKQFGFSSQAFCFFGKSFFKRLGLSETATQHDATSCIRVLTVGFCSSDPNMQSQGDLFQVNRNQIRTPPNST